MVRIFTAALSMALAAAPAAAQDGPSNASSSSSTSSSSSAGGTGMCREIAGTGRICCDNCGGGWPSDDPVDVPAPPALLLFAAGAMALAARRRAALRQVERSDLCG